MTEPETWCTDWTAYDVPRLWAMVSTEDSGDAWAQVSAWFRLRDAVDDQRERLAACRQALIEVWPPERSEASVAFLAVLDELVSSMTMTVDAADSTARGLAGVLESLATAKKQMQPLYDEWVARSTDLTPRWIDEAEDELNAKARAVMVEAESAVAHFTPMIKPPPEYELKARRDPSIPLDPQILPSGSTATGSPLGLQESASPVPHFPPLPDTDQFIPENPVLAGSSSPLPGLLPLVSDTPIPPRDSTRSMGPPLSPLSWRLIPTPPAPAPATGGVINPVSLQAQAGGSAHNSSLGSAAARGTVPGLVAPSVGASGGAAAKQPGGGPLTANTPRHVTPPIGNGYRTPDGHVVRVSGLGVRTGETAQRPSIDPHDPWTLQVGVPPVVTPDPPRHHDPGPSVIGMDR